MDYRPLGRSGLTVSSFGLGVMSFRGQTPEDDAFRQMDMAFDAGITLFDTAENYPTPLKEESQGRSEEILGRWILSCGVRDKVVVATKVAGPGNAAVGALNYIRGDTRKLDQANIRQVVEDSLHRLSTDKIDLYQVHWSERRITTLGRARYSRIPYSPGRVPIAETLAALDELVLSAFAPDTLIEGRGGFEPVSASMAKTYAVAGVQCRDHCQRFGGGWLIVKRSNANLWVEMQPKTPKIGTKQGVMTAVF
jgi:aryl-alcohol dehydrogenase-like predicted oxidoreductase